MTSQKDQIQALITDIDGVLQKTTPRLPWVVSGEMTQQRQVLERVRNYLVAFQRRQIAGEGFGQAGARPDLLVHDIYYQPTQQYPSLQEEARSGQPLHGQDELNAQQMLQAIVQEMGYLRSNLMQPLQTDLEALHQQREALVHEIRQLEAQRQGYAGQGYTGQLPGQQQLITEFLQALMSRLQETLPQQVAQTLRSSNQQTLPQAHNLALAGSAPSVIATSDAPSQGLGNIQVSQSSSDELLIRLDSTLSIVFESLQRNVQAYQESLSQGLDKMHSMGQQGEMMFTALISHLAQQLGRETSSYLQPSVPTNREAARSPSPPMGLPTNPPVPTQPSMLKQPGAEAAPLPLSLPFPGTEMVDRAHTSAASTNVPEPSVDTAIDSWLRSAASTAPDVDFEIAALNLEGFDLSQLAAQDVNALLELDATLLGTNLPSQPLLSPTAPIETPSAPADASTVEDTADIDAALKLLEQLSAELHEPPSSVADAEAQIDRMLSSPAALAGDPSSAGIPDDARDELDEFYESLFGADAIGTPTQAPSTDPATTQTTPQPTLAPVNQSVIEPAAIAPLDQPAVQPISTLPAETQMPTGALAEPTAPASASTVADPTLGWHLPTAPLVTPTLETSTLETSISEEIPAALLEDELLDGWNLADADLALSEPETTPTTDDLLGGWDISSVDDRASQPLDAPATPATADLPAGFDESHPASDASPAVLQSDVAASQPNELGQDVSSQETASHDAISTLTDLFGDTAFGDTVPAQEPPLEFAIADPLTPPVASEQSVGLTASPTTPSFDVSPTQMPTADPLPPNLADGYLTDDRYAPASPDEDLLPLDEPIEPLDSELWLDETTLNRLSEDLFNLEEAIGEPSILPYGTEPDDSAAFLAGTTDVANVATTADVPFPSETTLGDWSDASLDDFTANLGDVAANEVAPGNLAPDTVADASSTTHLALFSLESENRAIAAEPPNTFILEGMDDLFANTPVAPPVTPIPPPVPPAMESTVPFALEGMDDLFADPLVSDQSIAAASTSAEPLFSLDGADEPFAEDTVVSPAVLPSASPPAERPFTLQGVDELFADDPVINPLSLPSSAPSPATDQPLPFTLEGVDELFADMPPINATPPTLDHSPAILPIADSLAAESEATPKPLPEDAAIPAPFNLEQVSNLFMEVPSGNPTLGQQAATPSAPSALTPAPFTLEQVGDLFVETPSEAAPAAPSDAPLPTQPPATSEPSALEQAFASLMGSFKEPIDTVRLLTDETDAATDTSEKSK